jgi:hypothetical protein
LNKKIQIDLDIQQLIIQAFKIEHPTDIITMMRIGFGDKYKNILPRSLRDEFDMKLIDLYNAYVEIEKKFRENNYREIHEAMENDE